jgi:hypothetical protein
LTNVEYTSLDPSGETLGRDSGPFPSVRRTGAPPFAATRHSARDPLRTDEK